MAWQVDILDEINMRISEGYGYEKNEYMLWLETRILDGEIRNDDPEYEKELYQVLNGKIKPTFEVKQ